MSRPPSNPCSYKSVCKECSFAAQDQRPSMCLQLDCEDYTPCTKCKKNAALVDGVCGWCRGTETKDRPDLDADAEQIITKLTEDVEPQGRDIPEEEVYSVKDATFSDEVDTELPDRSANLSISVPGKTPKGYSPEESEYYKDSWKEYTQWYSDPSVKFIVHQIILHEVEINFLSSYIIHARQNLQKRAEEKLDKMIKRIGELRKMLPEKEALELSDADKALSVIHDKYCEEIAKNTRGGVRRVISPSAIALAPHLHFPVDCTELLELCGYSLTEAKEAAEKIREIPEDPEEMLEFFHYQLKEKYATAPKEEGLTPIRIENSEIPEDES